MSTIPASKYVNITPGVQSAGGSSLVLNGLMLTTNPRVPIGTVVPFANPTALQSYFGGAAAEVTDGMTYFNGYNNSSVKPGSLLIAQYNETAVGAYLRGGNVSSFSLTMLQGLSGTLSVVMDGYTHSGGSINLSAASSFSSAAGIIQTALTASEPTEATFTGSLGAQFTGNSTGTTSLVITGVTGYISVGDPVTGAGVPTNTKIVAFVSGTVGGAGTYTTNNATTLSAIACTSTSSVLDVSAVASGALAVGQTVTGSSVAAGSIITAQLTGAAGAIGTYQLSGAAQGVASESMTGVATAPTVTYDSVSGAFIISSGITGVPSTAAYATGTLAPLIYLTLSTGAVLSQGAAPASPASFMTALASTTQNWASFWTLFDPDGGTGNAQKLLFSQWTNGQNNRFAYLCWDPDGSPRASSSASGSLGALITAAGYSGTVPISETTGETLQGYAAFAASYPASLDFGAIGGRTDFDFRAGPGLVADVTDITTADNLEDNNYNYYGAVATANAGFVFMQPGTVSGPFKWFDSFVNQIWMNSNFQLSLMTLLTTVNSIPFNNAGYSMIEQALQDNINQALAFGAIRTGVQLSSVQASAVNSQANAKIDGVLFSQGWYLQVLDPGATVRGERGSPICIFWYMDGESVQTIDLSSVLIQ